MPDISTELETIETALLGEKVRDGVVNAIRKINNEGLLTVDNLPEENSEHPVYSGGVYNAIQMKKRQTKTVTVVIDSNGWTQTEPYTKNVTIPGATMNTKVDIIRESSLINYLIDNFIVAVWFENDGGSISIKTIGAAPKSSFLVLKCILTEGVVSIG